ncbi:MAG: Reeler domain-containing protein [Bryobacter sp.]|nr:Reeler domain-containing protein [Bryobacter sp.]
MKIRFLALSIALAAPAMAVSTGAPAARTGAPPGTTCTACHAGTANSGPGSLRVEFPSGSSYTPGSTYRLRVTLSDPAATRWGFQVTARAGAENTTLSGTFVLANATTTRFSAGAPAGEYVTHTAAGTAQGTTGSNSWEVDWTAPAAGAGTVTFFAAGNAANNAGGNTGDSIYTTSLQITEASDTPVTGKKNILPQLVYGGGWYSALYFSNTTNAAVQVGVSFYGANGSPLSVPLVGVGPVSTHTVSIAARATVILEAPNSGALQQGWAEAVVPAGVTGYGVFRQSAAGRADQEAVVPLSEDSRLMANMVWDDTAMTTAMAVVNPDSAAIAVTLTVYGNDGAQIGTTTLNLAGRNRVTFVLREQPGMAGVTGKRGLARLSVTTGSVAALGLRFAGEAITSIPVSYP